MRVVESCLFWGKPRYDSGNQKEYRWSGSEDAIEDNTFFRWENARENELGGQRMKDLS